MVKRSSIYSHRIHLSILIVVHCILPLLVGGLIYILFRPTTLRMFNWFENTGLMEAVHAMRRVSQNFTFLPDWLYYALPDGLWTYSFTSAFILIWGHDSSLKYWLVVPLSLSLIPEFLQFYGLLPGTFDWNDLFFQFFGFIFSLMFCSYTKTKMIV